MTGGIFDKKPIPGVPGAMSVTGGLLAFDCKWTILVAATFRCLAPLQGGLFSLSYDGGMVSYIRYQIFIEKRKEMIMQPVLLVTGKLLLLMAFHTPCYCQL